MVTISEEDKSYAQDLAAKCGDVIFDMLAKRDYQALHEFGNQVNGLAAERGLPHREPVALLNVDELKPEDFEKGAA
jgi:hypothetical protein